MLPDWPAGYGDYEIECGKEIGLLTLIVTDVHRLTNRKLEVDNV